MCCRGEGQRSALLWYCCVKGVCCGDVGQSCGHNLDLHHCGHNLDLHHHSSSLDRCVAVVSLWCRCVGEVGCSGVARRRGLRAHFCSSEDCVTVVCCIGGGCCSGVCRRRVLQWCAASEECVALVCVTRVCCGGVIPMSVLQWCICKECVAVVCIERVCCRNAPARR